MNLFNWESDGESLLIGGKTVSSLVKQYGTPLYLYNTNVIVDRINQIKREFPEFIVLYSIKSNPNMAICSLIAKLGLGAAIASMGEFDMARKVGFPIQVIAVSGQGKRYEEIEKYITAGVRTIYLESEREIELIEEISTKKHVSVSAMIRITPFSRLKSAHEQMGGVPSQFGIPEECITNILTKTKKMYTSFIGTHAYGGSQILDQETLVDHFLMVANMSKRIATDVGFKLQCINFGGGFGVPYDLIDLPLDIKMLGARIIEALHEIFPVNRPIFYIELGRYLVAESGIFLTEVLDIKHSKGITFVITDSGINNFARPAMPWAMQHPCSLVSKLSEPKTGIYRIVGSLCQPSDVLCREIALADPQPGDIIAFFNTGAYGYTMSPQLYHSKIMPAEVLYHQGDFYVTRERLTYEESLSHQSIPQPLQSNS